MWFVDLETVGLMGAASRISITAAHSLGFRVGEATKKLPHSESLFKKSLLKDSQTVRKVHIVWWNQDWTVEPRFHCLLHLQNGSLELSQINHQVLGHLSYDVSSQVDQVTVSSPGCSKLQAAPSSTWLGFYSHLHCQQWDLIQTCVCVFPNRV